ncbi:[Pyruvate dehydrogenase (acetyl-transferring)] kinase isozyme 2 [Microbotryomycetes sp. JL221]|nr:[Pyruvate dehydrogenase (acetyl-transferring)] kinase isozyme 2 [Microbotryomycetes sp. JL221]
MAPYQIQSALWKQILHYATFPQTGVSLRQMVMFGQNPSQELPIRLAHRVKELDTLPNNLNRMPSIEKVKKWYAESFEELVTFPKPDLPASIQEAFVRASHDSPSLPEATPNPSLPEHMKPPSSTKGSNGRQRPSIQHRYYVEPDTSIRWPPEVHDYNERFTKLLSNIKRRHDPVVTTIAQGILEYKRESNSPHIDRSIQTFLDRFYMSRIGIRVLIGQHIALNRLEPHEDYVGIICTKTNIHQIAREAIDNALFVCEEHFGLFKGPPVQLICPKDLTFMYVPSHLNHILFEVLKNSLRAVVETHGVDCETYPPVKVIVAEGNEDITIKISDEGGGIPRSALPLVWTFMYTTANPENLDQDFQGTDFKAPMAGFGYGLPIARLYAQYFGGSLKLISMEGYGTDCYIHLSRLSKSSEPLQ